MSEFSDWVAQLKEELGVAGGEFMPGAVYYTPFNESINVLLEDVPYYAKYISNDVPNQLHTLHANDDDRIVGFSVWWIKSIISD